MTYRLRRLLALPLPILLAACGSSANNRAPSDGGTFFDGHSRPDDSVVDSATAGTDSSTDMLSLPPGAALRLIAPLSTATVTSQRPTLRWRLDPTCDGAHIQICRDRACQHEVAAFDATGTSGAPASTLPPGVLFWRAYGRSGSAIVDGWTPTWEFNVGSRSAPLDTSWGTTLDVNGDGYADIAVGADTQVNVYLGSPAGLASSPDLVLSSAGMPGVYWGPFLASAGDVNGDGYADLIVGGTTAGYLFLGGPAGLTTLPAATLTSRGAQSGLRVASAGDVNGDGYADVVMANFDQAISYVYLGGPSGLSGAPDATLPSPVTGLGLFGHSVAGACDVDGDGYGDIVIGAPGAAPNGQAFVYLGGEGGIATAPSFTLAGPDGTAASFGNSVSCAGDVDGDGYADLLIGADAADGAATGTFTGRAYVYRGGQAGVGPSPLVTLFGDQPREALGRWVSGAGDVNGDGYADVIVGADGENGADTTASGWAYVYLGGPDGTAAKAATTLTGPDGQGSWFGRCVTGAGDVNGDGYADVVVGADAGNVLVGADGGVPNTSGWAYVYLGSAAGVGVSPAARWIGPSSGSAFGRALASAVRFRVGPTDQALLFSFSGRWDDGVALLSPRSQARGARRVRLRVL
jgi:hypothetical protein